MPDYNTSEIDEMRWLTVEELDAELLNHPMQYTPWFKQEWAQLKRDHGKAIGYAKT